MKWFVGTSILLLAFAVSVSLVISTIASADVDNIERFISLTNNTTTNVSWRRPDVDNIDNLMSRDKIETEVEFQKTIDEWVRAE